MKLIKVLIILFLSSSLISAQDNADLWDVVAINQDTVFICGENGTLIRTFNGGSTWQIQQRISGIWDILGSFCFINNEYGWIATRSGNILRTINGGHSWLVKNIQPREISIAFYEVFFVDTLQGWICGIDHHCFDWKNCWDTGNIFRTNDAGNNWVEQKNVSYIDAEPEEYRFRSSYFKNSSTGWIVGEQIRPVHEGMLFKTENGGDDWIQQPIPKVDGSIEKIFFLNDLVGWIVGMNSKIDSSGKLYWLIQLLRSIDGGTSWEKLTEFDYVDSARDIYFVNPGKGFIVSGDLGSKNYGHILVTSDSGYTWQTNSTYDDCIYAIDLASNQIGWCVGENSLILKTVDGGNIWEVQDLFANSNENEIPDMPNEYILFQNYPNPFNPRTIINYELPITNFVEIAVYNLLGKKIATLVSEKQSAGYHEVEFNGQNLSSGVYLYRIDAGNWWDVRKMVLLR